MFDLSLLPKKAQDELIDFYHFLIQRYSKKNEIKNKESQIRNEIIDTFFENYNLDLKDFNFNRNDIYER